MSTEADTVSMPLPKLMQVRPERAAQQVFKPMRAALQSQVKLGNLAAAAALGGTARMAGSYGRDGEKDCGYFKDSGYVINKLENI